MRDLSLGRGKYCWVVSCYLLCEPGREVQLGDCHRANPYEKVGRKQACDSRSLQFVSIREKKRERTHLAENKCKEISC